MNEIFENETPDGIFIANERMVPGVIQALRNAPFTESSYNPKIIYVGTSRSEYINYPNMSLVTCDWRKLMEKVLKILFARIKEKSLPYRDYHMPFKIIEQGQEYDGQEFVLKQHQEKHQNQPVMTE